MEQIGRIRAVTVFRRAETSLPSLLKSWIYESHIRLLKNEKMTFSWITCICIAWASIVYLWLSIYDQEPSSSKPRGCVTTRLQSAAIMRRRDGDRKRGIKTPALSAPGRAGNEPSQILKFYNHGARRRPLLRPSPCWKPLLVLSHKTQIFYVYLLRWRYGMCLTHV